MAPLGWTRSPNGSNLDCSSPDLLAMVVPQMCAWQSFRLANTNTKNKMNILVNAEKLYGKIKENLF